MRWISLQVTLKSSSWWHSQGGDGHPFPPRVLGRVRSSARSSRGVGLIFQGSQGYFFILYNLLGPLRPGFSQAEGQRERGRREASLG